MAIAMAIPSLNHPRRQVKMAMAIAMAIPQTPHPNGNSNSNGKPLHTTLVPQEAGSRRQLPFPAPPLNGNGSGNGNPLPPPGRQEAGSRRQGKMAMAIKKRGELRSPRVVRCGEAATGSHPPKKRMPQHWLTIPWHPHDCSTATRIHR
jgi:hypothetical protein